MQYSFAITLKKGIKYIVIFGIPFIAIQFIALYPDIANLTFLDIVKLFVPKYWLELTVGGALVMAVNWLKNYAGIRLP